MTPKPHDLGWGLQVGGAAAVLLSIPVVVLMANSWSLFVLLGAASVGIVAINVGAFASVDRKWGVVAVASGFLVPCLLAFALLLVGARDRVEAGSECDPGGPADEATASHRCPVR